MRNSLILRTTNLSDNHWGAIFLTIESIKNGQSLPSKELEELGINIQNISNYGINVQEYLPRLSIVYSKSDVRRDFSDILPFLYARNNYNCELIIVFTEADRQLTTRYIYSCAQFLEDNLDGIFIRTQGSSKSLKDYLHEDNRRYSNRFSPLITLNCNSFNSLFLSQDLSEYDALFQYIERLRNNNIFREKNIFPKGVKAIWYYPFAELFIRSFFINYLEEKPIPSQQCITTICQQLLFYSDSIRELAENIIYHTTSKKGFLYYSYNKPSDIVDKEIDCNNLLRVVSFGVYDFSSDGILDTYNCIDTDSDTISLSDFFNPQSVVTLETTKLAMRYAAHLGLKSFSSAVVSNGGVFHVSSVNRKKDKTAFVDVYAKRPIETHFSSPSSSIPGTHYNILLPLREPDQIDGKQDITSITSISTLNFSDLLTSIYAIPIDVQTPVSPIVNKQDQISYIQKIGDKIIRQVQSDESDMLALDAQDVFPKIDAGILFKVLAYLQFSINNPKKYIVVFNTKIDVLDKLSSIVKSLPDDRVWSNDSCLIFFSKEFASRVFSGSSRMTFNRRNLLIAQQYHVICSDFSDNQFIYGSTASIDAEGDSFLSRAYDVIVKSSNGTSFFEGYLVERLNIPQIDGGYKLTDAFAKLGDQVIIKDFYEAYSLFGNSFYVNRFAYLFLSRLSVVIRNISQIKKILLIGYGSYSDLLLDTITTFAKDKIPMEHIIACDNGGSISWPSDTERFGNGYHYVIITPIGTTLTSHERILHSFIKKTQANNNDFIFHYAVILVRDSLSGQYGLSSLEKKMGWTGVDIDQKLIHIRRENINLDISYQICLSTQWYSPRSHAILFPADFQDETPTTLAKKNNTIHPDVDLSAPKISSIEPDAFDKYLTHLSDIKRHIYYGNIKIKAHQYRYYFDTEGFIRSPYELRPDSYKKWLLDLHLFFRERNSTYVLITQQRHLNSGFISEVNSRVFDGRGVIVIYHTDRPFDNYVAGMYPYLKSLYLSSTSKCQFVFVDHALESGNTYTASQSFISSVIGQKIEFSYSIVLLDKRPVFFDGEFAYIRLYPFSETLHINLRYQDVSAQSSQYYTLEAVNFWKRELLLEESTILNQSNQISNSNYLALVFSQKILHEISHNRLDEVQNLLHKNIEQEQNMDYLLSKMWVLCAPPFTTYLEIRKLIIPILLNKLFVCLDKRSNYTIDDLVFLIHVQAVLSDFGSVAVLRKVVLLKSWDLYFKYRDILLKNEHIANKDLSSRDVSYQRTLFDDAKLDEIERAKPLIGVFKSLYSFNVKKLLAHDEALALYIGFLLRTGSEPVDDYSLLIPETVWNNDLFVYFQTKFSNVSAFKTCLSEIYNDNTTIIRKYISSISANGISNIGSLSEDARAYVTQSLDGKLEFFSQHLLEINKIINDKTHSDLSESLNTILSEMCVVMSADRARIVLANEPELTQKMTLFVVAVNGKTTMAQDFKIINEGSYAYRTMSRKYRTLPIVIQQELDKYSEKIEYDAQTMCMMLIPKGSELSSANAIGSIDFFYKEGELERQKQIIRERGRLLMILLPQLGSYFERVLGRETINNRLELLRLSVLSENLLKKSEHFMNSSVNQSIKNIMDFLSSLVGNPDYDDAVQKLAKPLYSLSNNVVSTMHMLIECNDAKLSNSTGSKVSEVFSRPFIDVLKTLLKQWTDSRDDILSVEDNRTNCDNNETYYDRTNLQVFIIQCIHNAFKKYVAKEQKIKLIINDDKVVIWNNNISVPEKAVNKLKKEFDEKWKYVITTKQSNSRFTCSAIKSLYWYSYGINSKLNCFFTDKNEFVVEIYYS